MRQKLQNVRKGAFRRRRVILAPIAVPAILAAILALKVTEMIIKAFQKRVPLRWEVVGVGKKVFLRKL